MAKESDQHRLLRDGPEDSEDDLGFPANLSPGCRKTSGVMSFPRSCYFISVLITVCMASFWAGTQIPIRKSSLDAKCAAHTTEWSPLLKDVSVRYETHLFNGSFMRENVYRQPGSPVVDKAWDDLGVNYRAGIISYGDGLASGLKPSFVQRADKYGGGFLVNVEGMHHLHCLNLVRKALYFNYDYYTKLGEHAFKNDENILRPHITHCLDAVRQVLMCNADTGVLGQVWARNGGSVPFPDFNSKHKCKNYDDIRVWAKNLERPPNEEIPDDYLARPRLEDVLQMVP